MREWQGIGGRALVLGGMLALGCARPANAPALDAGAGAADAAASRADGGAEADPRTEFERVMSAFGNLETLAGRGEIDGDRNDWDPAFEGGLARDAELSTPHNALGDDAGNVYIADKDAHAIRKVTPAGRIVTVAGVNAPGADARHLSSPNGLWVRGDGTVYILDLGNARVQRLDPAAVRGEMTTLFAIGNPGTGRGLWVSDDESLAYVSAGTEVRRWTRAGGVSTFARGFSDLGNLYAEAPDQVVVTDRGASRVFRIGADGMAAPIAGNGDSTGGGDGQPGLATGLAGVRGVWRHPLGGLFLATHAGSQVWYLDTAGTIHLVLDGPGLPHAGDGQAMTTPGRKVREVRSVTMDRSGNLLITEHDNGVVRIGRRH